MLRREREWEREVKPLEVKKTTRAPYNTTRIVMASLTFLARLGSGWNFPRNINNYVNIVIRGGSEYGTRHEGLGYRVRDSAGPEVRQRTDRKKKRKKRGRTRVLDVRISSEMPGGREQRVDLRVFLSISRALRSRTYTTQHPFCAPSPWQPPLSPHTLTHSHEP